MEWESVYRLKVGKYKLEVKKHSDGDWQWGAKIDGDDVWEIGWGTNFNNPEDAKRAAEHWVNEKIATEG